MLYLLSKISSVISLTIWGFAQLPQILLNYNRKSFDISVLFITIWSLGDVTNLLYHVVIKDISYSAMIGYLIFLDIILLSQYFYYGNDTTNEDEDEGYGVTQPTTPTLVNKLFGGAFLTSVSSAMTISHPYTKPDTTINWKKYLPIACSFLYIISRLPQIRKNYIQKSTVGLSKSMVILSLLGTLFNFVSMVSNSQLYQIYSDDTFIIGSIGTILMDSFLLYQFSIYRKPPILHAPVTNINEHPQWYVKNQPLVFYKPEELSSTNEQQQQQSKTSFSENSIQPVRSRGRKLVKSPYEESLIIDEESSYVTTPPPPQHYIVSSSARRLSGHIQHIPKTIPQSLTSSSIGSATSFIPSIINNISSVNKKLLDGSKVPFSPIDFLADDFYPKPSTSSAKESTNGSSSKAYYGSVDI
ncbi:YPQ1 Probable vacuolar amino acid transporter YPQ1 [Candida maltosa Xu316]